MTLSKKMTLSDAKNLALKFPGANSRPSIRKLCSDVVDFTAILTENNEQKIKELFVQKILTMDITSVLKIMELKSGEIDFTKEINENIIYLKLMAKKLFTRDSIRALKGDEIDFNIENIYLMRKYFGHAINLDNKIKSRFLSLIAQYRPCLSGAIYIKEKCFDIDFESEIMLSLRYFLGKQCTGSRISINDLDYVILIINKFGDGMNFTSEIKDSTLSIKKILRLSIGKIDLEDLVRIVGFFSEYMDISEELKKHMLFFIKNSIPKMQKFYEFLESNPKTRGINFDGIISEGFEYRIKHNEFRQAQEIEKYFNINLFH